MMSNSRNTSIGTGINNKAVLDTIAGGSYGECLYAEIVEKIEKISWTLKFGVKGSQILGEIPLQCNHLTTQPHM